MNLEHVSVENRKKFPQSYLPGFEESTIFPPQRANFNPGDKSIDGTQVTNSGVARILRRLTDEGLLWV